ncbi:MAG: DUF1080 domain-containing protein [Deltaproteobacteria bacterium]|jgi:hypothetical protein|nr:DUF1080 domain-containing protein [Deltaproteobacteria bacterium]MBT4087719.1 DUF1080 domain-containing protein [Deltaproteobacteria bacterium]MBT4638182.1 DUF1080 domain-containing protein [Deltaproteobacteria bacterium]MBT6499258.1 DUF1080 domain-containing protein [Deltaproteobacteria bacterium]MBT7153409.1 DUF1080 domain-containing protein [Deltaproteobacteria bacterium]
MKRRLKKSFNLMVGLALIFMTGLHLVYADTTQRVMTIPIDPDLKAWKVKGPKLISKWEAGIAKINPDNPKKMIATTSNGTSLELVNKSKGSLDIFTRENVGDCTIELEVMVAKQANSGIYVMGQYEVQVKDSFGKDWFIGNDDMGGIIGTSKPITNAALEYGQWQRYVIEFKAPRFKNGKRSEPAEFVKVSLNGKIVQEHVQMNNGSTSGALRNGEYAEGPLMLQGGLGAIAYRNIRILQK